MHINMGGINHNKQEDPIRPTILLTATKPIQFTVMAAKTQYNA
jgi:hypothetical protein